MSQLNLSIDKLKDSIVAEKIADFKNSFFADFLDIIPLSNARGS